MWKTFIILIVGDQVIIHYNEHFLLQSLCVINQTLRTVASFMLHVGDGRNLLQQITFLIVEIYLRGTEVLIS